MTEQVQEQTQLPVAPSDAEIQGIREQGRAVVAHKRECVTLARQIEGLEFGTVKGAALSPATRYALAEFCRITRANPLIHVDILGGKPYHNAAYWSDLVTSDEHFHRFEQREISSTREQELRDRAKELRDEAAALDGSDVRGAMLQGRALELEQEAEEIWMARGQYRVPEWAQVAYETTIWRFTNQAPIELIRSGELTDFDRFLVPVMECNWAGGRPEKKKKGGGGGTYQPDPVGNEEPEKTARTRSFRRVAVKAFPAWMERYEEQIHKAEAIIEAEFEIIRSDDAAALRSLPTGEQAAATGRGEPTAAAAAGAEELPGTIEPSPNSGEPPDEPSEQEAEWDVDDARKAFFANLHAAGIKGDGRKRWMADNGLPDSVTKFGQADYSKAMDALFAPVRKAYREGCDVVGVDAEDFALQELGGLPQRYEEFVKLLERLNALADKQAVQRELV